MLFKKPLPDENITKNVLISTGCLLSMNFSESKSLQRSYNPLILNPSFFYILLLIIHIGLVWVMPYFPSQDGSSHIYNLVILKDLINGGKEWGSFFTYQLSAVPNLGFNLVSYPLLELFSPLIVEKIFISIYIILLGSSVPFFLHTFNKTSFPFIYFVFPVIFNFNLMMGFYSYVISVPLFLFAFSISWKIRDRFAVYKFVFFNLTGLMIFYFHIIPFILFLLSLLCITIVQSKGFKRAVFDQIKLISIISPSLLVLFLYMEKSAKGFIPDFSYLSSLSRYIYLMNDLFLFSTVTFSPWQMFPGFIFTGLFLCFFILSIYSLIKDPDYGWLNIRDISVSDKALICLSCFLLLIYFVTPFRFGGGDFFNQRLPWLILIILLPLMRINKFFFSKRFLLISIASVAVLFFAFNSVILWHQTSRVEKFMSGLNEVVPKGAYVMTYKKRDPEAGWPRVDALMHAASYYGIFKGCVDIGNYETGRDYFPIKFKDPVPKFPSLDQIAYKAETVKWSEYPSIQYIFAWEINKNDTEKLSKFFHILWKEEPFSIWKRNSINS